MNVSIIAIARNEGPYLAEWIYHHIYMGFKKFYIGINKTTDNSLEIINLIDNKNINVFNLDWLHLSGRNFQPAAYSYMLNEIKNNLNNEDFICFIDIDEYWFTPNMSIKISKYLSQPKFKNADMISFPWAYQEGDKAEFLPPFKNQKIYFGGHKNNPGISNNVKSFFRSSSIKKILQIKVHSCNLTENSTHLFHNGNEFQPFCGSSAKEQTVLKEDLGYILHRIKRSEREYLALLLNTINGELIKPFKSSQHRKSYSINVKKIVLENQNKAYFNHLESQFLKKKLIKAIDLAREKKLSTIDKFLEIDNDVLINNLSSLLIKSYGTTFFNDVITRITDDNFNLDINNETKAAEVEACLEFLTKKHFENNFNQLIKKMQESLTKNIRE